MPVTIPAHQADPDGDRQTVDSEMSSTSVSSSHLCTITQGGYPAVDDEVRTGTEGAAVKRIQIAKPTRRPADVPLDLRTPSGRQLPF
jgi:hypothetical protein